MAPSSRTKKADPASAGAAPTRSSSRTKAVAAPAAAKPSKPSAKASAGGTQKTAAATKPSKGKAATTSKKLNATGPAKPAGVKKRTAPTKKAIAPPKGTPVKKPAASTKKAATPVPAPKKTAPAASKKAAGAETTKAAAGPSTAAKKPAAKKAAATKKATEPKPSRKRGAPATAAQAPEEEAVIEPLEAAAAEAAEAAAPEPEAQPAAEAAAGGSDAMETDAGSSKPAPKRKAAAPKAAKPPPKPRAPAKRKAAAAAVEEAAAAEVAEGGEAQAEEAGPSAAPVAPPAKKRRGAAPAAAAAVPEPAAAGFDLFVFGTNPFGALGLGEDETVKYRPCQVVVEGCSWAQVTCGGMHTVALTPAGALYSWGVNDEGALGRPTAGTCWEAEAEAADAGKQDATVPQPMVMPEGVVFTQVAAGDGFTMALSTDGAVYGCGTFKDDVGSLTGFTTSQKLVKTLQPLIMPKAAKQRVAAIAAGARHCLALTEGGEVLSWGIGSQGQLGRVPVYDAEAPLGPEELFTPKGVPGVLAGLKRTTVVGIATGAYSSFALTKAGDVVAWGLNNSGQLGLPVVPTAPRHTHADEPQAAPSAAAPEANGNTADASAAPAEDAEPAAAPADGAAAPVAEGAAEKQAEDGAKGEAEEGPKEKEVNPNLQWTPVKVPGLSHVLAVKGGEQHTLALTKAGQVLSFGAGTYGMLGRHDLDVSTADKVHPEPTPVDGLDGVHVVSLAAGTNVSACVAEDGRLWTWGSNVNYQLAKGDTDEDASVPELFKRHKAFGLRPVKAVSFGGQHAALLAGAAPAPTAPPAAPPPAAEPAAEPAPAVAEESTAEPAPAEAAATAAETAEAPAETAAAPAAPQEQAAPEPEHGPDAAAADAPVAGDAC